MKSVFMIAYVYEIISVLKGNQVNSLLEVWYLNYLIYKYQGSWDSKKYVSPFCVCNYTASVQIQHAKGADARAEERRWQFNVQAMQ